ncbi:hypothetical protein LCGC14_1714380 [marine sediment metagenome]|uniref:Phage capsid-like C-terminal domain-containing protein n=1 Tax=marine sediment metagenome TaxID=412755 RepID=A0A0F9KEA8_9ZZZZ
MASKLKQLQDRQAALLNALRQTSDAFPDPPSDTADDKDRAAAKAKQEELQAKYDALKAELDEVKVALAREQELQEIEREMIPAGSGGATKGGDSAGGNGAVKIVDDPGQKKADAAKWESFGEQLRAVQLAASQHPAQWDKRLVPSAATGLSDAVGSEGLFLVGTDTSQELIRYAFDNTQVFGGAGYAGVRRIPISSTSNSVKINAVNETSRATGSRWGGVQLYWIETGGQKTGSKPDFRQIELSLKKLIGLCYATDELLQDTVALEAVIREAYASEFSFMIQDAVINGSGSGQPLGILNSSCLVTIAKESDQVAKTIVKENIDKMWTQMWPRGVAQSVWFINQDCYPQLFSMTQDVGTGGMPVYLPPGGLSASPFGTLMGRPVIPIEQCQTIGTKGDIFFCDLSEYLFADKGGIDFASSMHLRFDYDETAFRFVYRADGQPAWNAALTPYKSAGAAANKVSPMITLAAR